MRTRTPSQPPAGARWKPPYAGVGGARYGARGPARALGGLGRGMRRVPPALGRRVRRITNAQGAGESGLGRLIELHAVNSAGDMLITVALASTIFFSVPTGEARGRVALYLLVTMAPFALLAPIVGPLLDRVPHGRRAAMAAAMLARALLALAMARTVRTGGLELYPEALGVLVSSKAYGVVRSAIVPRLLPSNFSLVKANSRVTLAGLLATGAAAPVGALLHQVGPPWPLYGACAVFALGTAWSLGLPPAVDSARGEGRALLARLGHGVRRRGGAVRVGVRGAVRAGMRGEAPGERQGEGRRGARGGGTRPGLRTVGDAVRSALVANAALRALSGLLTFFLSFLLREHPVGGLSAVFSLGLVGVAAGGGNALGTAVGAWLRARGPELIIAAVLGCALAAMVAAATLYGAFTLTAAAAAAGATQALGKLSLDALIQRDVPEDVRTSAFARSETLLQMSWVAGGGLGISLPLLGRLGMAVAAGLVAVGAALTVRGLLRAARRGTPRPRVV